MGSERSSPGEMVAFDTEGGRFTLRVAGIAIVDGHVLLHKAVDGEYWILPGGRAELMEEARDTLKIGGFVRYSRWLKKSSHVQRNVNSAVVTSAGSASGTMIRRKTPAFEHPSIIAAS